MPSAPAVDDDLTARLAMTRRARTVVRDHRSGAARRLQAHVSANRNARAVTLIETGAWEDGRATHNALRWTMADEGLELVHLRRGESRPRTLVHFRLASPTRLECETPHDCPPDRYHASLRVTDSHVALRWRISGPSKRLTITTLYQ